MRPLPRYLLCICLTAGLPVLAGCGSASGSHTAGSSGSTTTSTVVSPTPARATSGGLRFAAPRVLAQGTGLASVSCGGADSCMALDDEGRADHFDGSTWSSPTPATAQSMGPGSVSVSCATATSCMAIATAGSQIVSWDGQGWSAPVSLDGASGLEAVGCAPTGYCAAVDAQGDAFAFDGQSWQGTSGDWGSVSSISCVSASFCVSVSGGISQWNGQSWSMPNQFGTASSLTGVSCPTATFCTAVDQTGEVLQWNGQTWSTPARIEPGAASTAAVGASVTGVSCPTTTFCVAVDDQGGVLQWAGGRVTRTDVDAGRHLTSISCPSTSLCVAVDQTGRVVIGTPARQG